MKGLTLAEEHVRYIIGIFLAIIIVFCLWWFFFHRESDRRAEESARAFVQAVDDCCTDGEKRIAKIEMPQQAQLADFWQQLTPGGAGNEPYYYLFWESFPPEPPYNIGDIAQGNVFGTAASIIAPWSEDLPWNSNFMMTMTIDMVGLGIDVLGTGTVKDYLGKAGKKIGNAFLGDITKKITGSETYIKASEAIAKLKNFEGMPKGYVNGGRWLVREGLTLTAETSLYTVFCMYTFHESLGKCATYSLIAAFGTEFVAKPLFIKLALPAVKDAIKNAAMKIIGGKSYSYTMSISQNGAGWTYNPTEPTLYSGLDSYFSTSIDSTADGFLVSNNPDGIISSWNYDNQGQIIDGLMQTGTTTYEATVEYFGENSNPQTLDFFQANYENGKPTGILFKYREWKQSLKDKLVTPIKNVLVDGEGQVWGHYVFTPGEDGGLYLLSDTAGNFYADASINPNFEKNAKQLMDVIDPQKSYTREEAVETLKESIGNLKNDAIHGSMAIGSIDSKLDKVMQLCEFDPEYCDGHILQYLQDLHKDVFVDKTELKRLGQLIYDRDYLRVGEDLKKLPSRGVLGYTLVRVQDLYTPLGATYWDKQMSYQSFSYAGNRCDNDEICLQMGFFVRKYPLSQSCQDVGVKNIKLDRGTLVAPNPRFYLVSPCYSEVEVRREGDTIYVKPLMCPERGRNYCFATAGLVDWYTGLETGAMVANCVATGICALAESSTLVLAPKAILDFLGGCFGFGVKQECSLIGSAIRTTMDFYREAFLKYPDVYSLTKTAVGDLRGGYTCDKSKLECEWCYK